MILTQEQAVACVYAMDTSDLCAHLTIGADIDVQKTPSGCVIVEARNSSEHYRTVAEFVAAYDVPIAARPLDDVREQLKARKEGVQIYGTMWRVMAVLIVLGLVAAGWLEWSR